MYHHDDFPGTGKFTGCVNASLPSRSTQRTSAVLYDLFLYGADTIFVRVKKSPSECPDHNEYSNIRPIRLTTKIHHSDFSGCKTF